MHASKKITQEQLEHYATQLSQLLRGGEVIELVGDVGAGKTTFTKALARKLGVEGPIQSPTFTVSNRYEAHDNLTLVHYDFYRLRDAGLMREELAEVVSDESVITVIEWGDIISDVLPDDRLTLTLVPVSELERELTASSGSDRYDPMVEAVR